MIPVKDVTKGFFYIRKGLPFSQVIPYLNLLDQRINVTGWSAKLVVKESAEDGALTLHTFTSADGSIVLGNGTIELKIPLAATINAFDWTEGVGHLVLEKPTELPFVQALYTFIVLNSTTAMP